ncbi:hypothetical protein EVAR_73305_1 [Eumeta japonica]|uniref:Uncharacterized protein n=1 Tax=Eumeta variegata TaxID=151549 RepID=A0A4C1SCF6_EUMVA|nr:hypothetical protein EVAR_73305_1 [Eumeta japonica]
MDFIPEELEENPLTLEIAIDPDTKCMTMKTLIDDKTDSAVVIPAEIESGDPLLQSKTEEVDFEMMSELDQLIYLERQRLLNLREPKKCGKSKKPL